MPSTTTTRRVRPRREDVRAALIASAGECFEASGYFATSVDAIADKAGYTKGAVYSNFGGKPDLFAAVASERLATESQEFLSQARPMLNEDDARDDIIGKLGTALADHAVRRPLRWQVLLAEFRLTTLDDPSVALVYETLMRERIDRLVDCFGANPYLARMPEDRLAMSIQAILGMVNYVAMEHAAAPDLVDYEMVKKLAMAFLDVSLPHD